MKDVIKKTDFHFKQGEITEFAKAAQDAADYVKDSNYYWLKIKVHEDCITVEWCVQE